jgi:hypothetical protein
MAAPIVSVLLLTRNGIETLPRVLSFVRSQAAALPAEIVAVDSDSDDGTAELLRGKVDRLIEIRQGQFNHGTTRNLGVEACMAPLVVLLGGMRAGVGGWPHGGGPFMQSRQPGSPPGDARLRAPAPPIRVRCVSGEPRAYSSTPQFHSRQQTIPVGSVPNALPAARLAACVRQRVASGEVWERAVRGSRCRGPGMGQDVMLAGYGQVCVRTRLSCTPTNARPIRIAAHTWSIRLEGCSGSRQFVRPASRREHRGEHGA